MLNLVFFPSSPLIHYFSFQCSDTLYYCSALNTLHCSHMETSVLSGYLGKEHQKSCESRQQPGRASSAEEHQAAGEAVRLAFHGRKQSFRVRNAADRNRKWESRSISSASR